MRSKIVRIGNSQGVRIPKPLLEQAGLGEEIELTLVGRTIVIQAPTHPRAGWEAQFSEMSAAGDDLLLDDPIHTTFDHAEWEW